MSYVVQHRAALMQLPANSFELMLALKIALALRLFSHVLVVVLLAKTVLYLPW